MKKRLVYAAFSLFMSNIFTTSVFAQWVQTNWTATNSFFSLYSTQDMVFTRIWDSFNGGRVFYTFDNGTHWNQIASADGNIDILSLVGWEDSILAGTWDGLYRPVVGDPNWSWFAVEPNGIPADTAIGSMAIIGNTLFAGARGYVYESCIDEPSIWTDVSSGLPPDVRIAGIATNGKAMFVGSANNGVFVLSNDGKNWMAINSGLTDTHISQLVAVDRTLFAVTLKGIFVSDVNDVTSMPNADGVIQVTDTKGAIWYVEAGGSVWALNTNGTIWTANNSGLEHINCLLVVHDFLLAGTDDSGVYVSIDSGLTWVPFGSEMPADTRVWSMAVSGDNLNLFAGTSSGVWRAPVPTLADIEPTVPTTSFTKVRR